LAEQQIENPWYQGQAADSVTVTSGEKVIRFKNHHVVDVEKTQGQHVLKRDEFPRIFDDSQQQFGYLDTNNDSFITVADLQEGLSMSYDHTKLPMFSLAELDIAIGACDTDKDGKISMEEFKNYTEFNAQKITKEEDAVCNANKTSCVNSSRMKDMAASVEAHAKVVTTTRAPRQLRPGPRGDEKQRFKNSGQIAGLWTFGAPATAHEQFRNAFELNGVFPGLRVFARTRVAGWFWGYYQKSDPVSWISSYGFGSWSTGFVHAHHDSLTVKDYEPASPWRDGASNDQVWWPNRDVYYWVSGHTMGASGYTGLVSKQTDYPFLVKAARFASIYGDIPEPTHDKISGFLKEHTPGWQLLGMSWAKGGHAGLRHLKDMTLLMQEASTQDCVLVFSGSNDLSDWLGNLAVWSTSWCGMDGVHTGFVDELKQAVSSHGYKTTIKPKLASCSAVHVAGHSLGGAQAEVFSACVMNPKEPGEDGYDDYQLVAWEKGPVFEVVHSSPAGACFVTDKGRCVTDGIGKHDINERCTIKILQRATLKIAPGDFDTETYYDFVTIEGKRYSGKTGPHGVKVEVGSFMSWLSDYSIVNGGFKICA